MPYMLCCTYLKRNSIHIYWSSEEWLEVCTNKVGYRNNIKLGHIWIFAFWTLFQQSVIPKQVGVWYIWQKTKIRTGF
jgi:hypothetical protein